jgi:hypothetical protein
MPGNDAEWFLPPVVACSLLIAGNASTPAPSSPAHVREWRAHLEIVDEMQPATPVVSNAGTHTTSTYATMHLRVRVRPETGEDSSEFSLSARYPWGARTSMTPM